MRKIAAAGGGILNSAAKLGAMDVEELYEKCIRTIRKI
jgi:hypothetical protein